MAIDEQAKARFAEYVRIQAHGRDFIDREAETKILQSAIMQFDVSLAEGRQIMLGTLADNGCVVESNAERTIREVLGVFVKTGGIDRRRFAEAAMIYRRLCADSVGEDAAKKRIKQIMVEEGWPPKRRALLGSRRWYRLVEA